MEGPRTFLATVFTYTRLFFHRSSRLRVRLYRAAIVVVVFRRRRPLLKHPRLCLLP